MKGTHALAVPSSPQSALRLSVNLINHPSTHLFKDLKPRWAGTSVIPSIHSAKLHPTSSPHFMVVSHSGAEWNQDSFASLYLGNNKQTGEAAKKKKNYEGGSADRMLQPKLEGRVIQRLTTAAMFIWSGGSSSTETQQSLVLPPSRPGLCTLMQLLLNCGHWGD